MDTVLQRLTELSEITHAILVDKDGLIVAGMLRTEEEEVTGAMAAAAFGSIANFTNQINSGETQHVILETKNGTVQMEETGDMILIVTTKGTGNHGRVRLEMKKACKQLTQLMPSGY